MKERKERGSYRKKKKLRKTGQSEGKFIMEKGERLILNYPVNKGKRKRGKDSV